MKLEKIYNSLESSINDDSYSRRDAFRKAGKVGLAVAAAAVPLAMTGLMTKTAYAQSGIVDVLNFALTLEYLEASFYQQGISMGVIPGGDVAVFAQISKHENSHVITLQSTISQLGGTPVSSPSFDFTARGQYPDVFSNYQTFLTLSQSFEDTGVRAYKGQAVNLMSNDAVLTAALQIHSVEARHASEVRRIRAQKGWITNADGGGAPGAIYVREDNTSQGGVNVTGITTVSAQAVTEAFDETLTMAEVLAIANPFIN